MKNINVHIIALISIFFWGISYIWSKQVFEVYSPLTTIFLRLLISFISLFIFIYLTKQIEKIRKEDRLLFLVSSMFNPFLYFIGENFGLKLVPASLSAIIVATIPLFAPFAAYFYFKERLKPLNLAGLILSFIGLLLILITKNFEFQANPKGVDLLFLAVFSAVFYVVFLKKLTARYKPLTIITWQNLIGTLYFLPFFLFFDFKTFISIKPDTSVILSLFMLGIFASSLAFVLFTITVKRLGVIKSSLYTNLIPVFTAIFSYYFLGEVFSVQKLAGMAIVIAGVILSESGKISSIYSTNIKETKI